MKAPVEDSSSFIATATIQQGDEDGRDVLKIKQMPFSKCTGVTFIVVGILNLLVGGGMIGSILSIAVGSLIVGGPYVVFPFTPLTHTNSLT